MAKTQLPADIDIAALKTKVVQQSNLMQAGTGTPWEDRGAQGIFKAFFVTCIQSMTSPGKLWDEIRRPETTSDATGFALGCGIIAGLSWVIHSLWIPQDTSPIFRQKDPLYEVEWNQWYIGSALQLAAAIAGMVLLLKLANLIYQKLVPHGMATRIPSALTYNLLGYSLGPALLVCIPMYGWLIALLWILLLFTRVGLRRLALPAGASIINGVLALLITAAIAGAVYETGGFLWSNFGAAAVMKLPPPEQPMR